MAEQFLIVGLGNPGPRYANTRHNIGFLALEALAGQNSEWKEQDQAWACSMSVANKPVHLLRPLTMMNRSGLAVQAWAAKLAIEVPQLLVVHDELDFPLGKNRLKQGGGDGGHNGVASVAQNLLSEDFPRLRLGVGPRPQGADQADYVLSPFSPDEDLEAALNNAVAMIRSWLDVGLKETMNHYHQNLS